MGVRQMPVKPPAANTFHKGITPVVHSKRNKTNQPTNKRERIPAVQIKPVTRSSPDSPAQRQVNIEEEIRGEHWFLCMASQYESRQSLVNHIASSPATRGTKVALTIRLGVNEAFEGAIDGKGGRLDGEARHHRHQAALHEASHSFAHSDRLGTVTGGCTQ